MFKFGKDCSKLGRNFRDWDEIYLNWEETYLSIYKHSIVMQGENNFDLDLKD